MPKLPGEGGGGWGGEKGGGEEPEPLGCLISEWPDPHSQHQRLGFYAQSPCCPLGQLALMSARHQRFSKATAHQGLVSCPSPKRLIRGCWALWAAQDFPGWLQRSQSNLQLLCKGHRCGEGVPVLVGELIRPSNCLATSQVT